MIFSVASLTQWSQMSSATPFLCPLSWQFISSAALCYVCDFCSIVYRVVCWHQQISPLCHSSLWKPFCSIWLTIFTLSNKEKRNRCEWDSNHCKLLEVASKASLQSVILVALEGRGQNTHSHVILWQNCSYHLIVVLCWLWHSMDLLGEVRDEREMTAVATPLWSFSLVQNIRSSTHWDKLLEYRFYVKSSYRYVGPGKCATLTVNSLWLFCATSLADVK
jgi:hypothetical protein